MLETLRNAFKIKDIRNRIIFTFLMLVVIRIGSQLPIPGVNNELFSNWFASQTADGMGFFDAITGGSFYNMSIFALNITPYITSSIIMQLLTIAIPKLEEMQRDGEEGRKKIAEITRYLTVALALIEAIAMAISFKRGQMLQSDGILTIIMVIFTLTAGSAVLMWIGERITEKGVGNGISIVLTINIISRVPNDMGTLYQQFITGKSIPKGILAAVIIIAIIVAMVVFVVFLQGGERRIPVQYSKKIQGRKQVGGQSTYIPLKVNTGGVIPVIFAQSLLQTPVIIASLLGKGNGTELGNKAKQDMDQGLLVPDELTCDLVMDRIKQDDCENGFVLDGFPRTIPQAEALTAALEKINEKMDYAIDVDVPDENIVNRMSGRRACLNCGATYHIVSIPTNVEGICDRCGQPVVLRDDDKPETVQKRLTVYHEQTQPLIDYYKKQSILKTVDGTQPMEKVFADIVAILGE